MSSKEIRRLGRFCFIRVVLMLVLLPASLDAAPLDGKKLLEPNPVTDWVAAKIRDGIIKRLDLSGSQLAAIQDVVDQHRVDLLADAIAVKEARMSLLSQVRAEELEVESIQRAHADASAAELQLWLRAGGILQEVRDGGQHANDDVGGAEFYRKRGQKGADGQRFHYLDTDAVANDPSFTLHEIVVRNCRHVG